MDFSFQWWLRVFSCFLAPQLNVKNEEAKFHSWSYRPSVIEKTIERKYNKHFLCAFNHTIIIIFISFRHYTKQLRNSTTEKNQIKSMNGWKRKNSSTANFQSATVLSDICTATMGRSDSQSCKYNRRLIMYFGFSLLYHHNLANIDLITARKLRN